jgi:hypothetical protein
MSRCDQNHADLVPLRAGPFHEIGRTPCLSERVPMGRHPRLRHSTTAPLTRSIRDRGCTHGPRHDTGHAVPESNPKSRVGRRRAVARRADNQARAMAAIAVGEREEWTAPQRVKPVHSGVLHVLSGWSCRKARTARAARNGTAFFAVAPKERPASAHSPRTGLTRKVKICSATSLRRSSQEFTVPALLAQLPACADDFLRAWRRSNR